MLFDFRTDMHGQPARCVTSLEHLFAPVLISQDVKPSESNMGIISSKSNAIFGSDAEKQATPAIATIPAIPSLQKTTSRSIKP
jgi:hypothetical protein